MDLVETIARRIANRSGLRKRRFWASEDWDDVARAALSAISEAGWKMVPEEPTEAMVSAGYGEITTDIERDARDMPNVYNAMLAAAPLSHDTT